MIILRKIYPKVFQCSLFFVYLLYVGCGRPADIADVDDANACTIIIKFEEDISKSQIEEIKSFFSNGVFLEDAAWIETITGASVMGSNSFAQCIFSLPAHGDKVTFLKRKEVQIHDLLAKIGMKHYKIETHEK